MNFDIVSHRILLNSTAELRDRMSAVEDSIQYLEAIAKLEESKIQQNSNQPSFRSPSAQTTPFSSGWRTPESARTPRRSGARWPHKEPIAQDWVDHSVQYQTSSGWASTMPRRNGNPSWHETRSDGVRTLRYSPDPQDGRDAGSDSDNGVGDVPGYMRPLQRPMGKLIRNDNPICF